MSSCSHYFLQIKLMAYADHVLGYDEVDKQYFEYGPTDLAFPAEVCMHCGMLRAEDPERLVHIGRYDRNGALVQYKG